MKTAIKNLSDTRVMVTITLGKEELEAAEQVALTKMARKVKAPGFRKGHVPVSVAAKHVNPNELAQETVDNAMSKAIADAFLGEKIQALDRPEVEMKKFVPGQELEFTAEVDVLPKVKLGDYKKLGVKKGEAKVASKDVDEVLERMRQAQAEKSEVKRAAEIGDELVIDFIGKKDGEAFDGGTAKDYSLELGSNSFIPGFEEGLVGAKAGDKKDLNLKFPEEYHVDTLAGADVLFETTVKSVNEKQLPELNDEFAKKSGDDEVKTLKDLKASIKDGLATQKQQQIENEYKDALVDKLVEKSTAPAPEVLVNDQMRSIEQDMQQNLMYQGITLEQYLKAQGFESEDDWREKEVKPAAEKRIKAGLVLAELSKELEVDATDEEKEAHIAMYKSQYGNNPEMAKRFDDPQVQREVVNRLITEKTVEALADLNK
ncbi:trigger factor [Candidatus Nomurabacteria bacterium]|nr:trigger factor [Candidatus Nomurabacteria bacterium]